MLRTVSNWLGGRRKKFSAKINYEDVIKVLQGLEKKDGAVKKNLTGGLNIFYVDMIYNVDKIERYHFPGKKLEEVIKFLQDEFSPDPKKKYCKGRHMVYIKKGGKYKEGEYNEEQRHYFDLYFGSIEFKIGGEEILGSPYRKVFIDYDISIEQ